ncbi:hypothetical protein WL227_11725, partial [Staphylococcus warneri]
MLESLDTCVVHPGMFLSIMSEGLDMVEKLGSPNLRLPFDACHAAVVNDMEEVLAGRIDLVRHVPFADAPAR